MPEQTQLTQPYTTMEELQKYIVRKLGGCAVVVELTSEQVSDCIYDALDQFNHYLCKAEPRVSKSREGSVQIPLNPGDRGVVNCKILFPEDTRVYAQMNVFELMYRMVFPRMPLGDWYLLKVYYKMYQQIRGTDPDWYVDESTNTLYVDCWSGPYDIFYVVSRDLTIADLADLKAAYTRDFRKLAVAEAKIVVGRIRGKYGNSIPTPGGTLTTDAERLLSEGEKEKQEVEDKLEKIAKFSQSPIMWG